MGLASGFVSPGAYWREHDYSDYIPALGTSIVGMVGTASWGPMPGVDTGVTLPQLITNEAELIRIFGTPSKGSNDHMALHAARQYLARGNQLLFSRVGRRPKNGDASGTTYATKAAITLIDNQSPGAADALTVEARYYGTRGDDIRIIIANGATTGTVNIGIEIIADTSGQLPEAYQNWQEVETYYGLPVSSSSDNYFVTVLNTGNSDYSASGYVTLTDERADTTSTTVTPHTGTFRLGVSTPAEVSAATVANDGISDLDDDDFVGIETLAGPTGLQVFSNPEAVDVNTVCVPGRSGINVINGLIDICENDRRDCMALIDPPFGLPPVAVGSTEGVVEWHNGTSDDTYSTADSNPSAPIDSSYAALYWPWIEVGNPWASGDIWVPPSGAVAGVYTYNDFVAEPWYAPAGYNRGRIVANRTEYTPTQGHRDTMYRQGNAVNPIMSSPRDGIVVFGERTLQRRPTKRDHVHVRRMLLTIEKQIATAVKYLTFEPNDPATWRAFRNLTTPLMDFVKSRRGVEKFEIICNESTNPPILRNRNTMNGKIYLVPTGVAEIIVVDFVLFASGASFSETPESVV